MKYFTNLLIYDCKCYDRSDSETVFHTTLIWQQAIMKRIKHIDWTLGICSLILLRYILPISESLAEKKSWTKHLEKWPINRFYLKMLLRKNCYSRWLLLETWRRVVFSFLFSQVFVYFLELCLQKMTICSKRSLIHRFTLHSCSSNIKKHVCIYVYMYISPKTLPKLCLSTKFRNQEIRWNYCIFSQLSCSKAIMLLEAKYTAVEKKPCS